jgi:centrosomal protein CEP104
MFCGEVNEKFVKQGFDIHYWKDCPMLKQCNECKQVIEIAVQNEHLLTECQFKNNYKKCPRCTEAVNVTIPQENDYHFKAKQCLPYDKKSKLKLNFTSVTFLETNEF